jgi:division protein CdvB (Snf7/Vps24/ESCRT-III family)
MGKNFIKSWQQKENDDSLVSKIKNVARPSEGNLKQKIAEVTHRLDLQTKTLDTAVLRFQNRGADIFNRILKAMSQRDMARANVLATELSEIRKIEKMLSHASLGLQSVSMRLSTVSEMGDIITVLNPAKNMIGDIKAEMCTIFPEASQELGNIGNLLSDICSSSTQGMDMQVNSASSSPEAMQILQEAEFAAENKLKKSLPEVDLEKPLQRKGIEEALG